MFKRRSQHVFQGSHGSPPVWAACMVVLMISVANPAQAAPPAASSGSITRVVNEWGHAEPDGGSSTPAVSADGRFLAFTSSAANLVSGDTNGLPDVFVFDRVAGVTSRVSVASDGAQANSDLAQHAIAISANGRYVAFGSLADNLVPGDSNREFDIFVHDRATAQTSRVSLTSTGSEIADGARHPAMSADGRFVAFESAGAVVPGDSKIASDIYVHDREAGTTEWVSWAAEPSASHDTDEPVISATGRYVSFRSNAVFPEDTDDNTDIVVYDRWTQTARLGTPPPTGNAAEWSAITDPHDMSGDGRLLVFTAGTVGQTDVFVHDLATGSIEQVSVATDGTPGNAQSEAPSISAAGRYVTFLSSATNLVDGQVEGGLFIHDRLSGVTSQVVAGDASAHDITDDGRFVAFASGAPHLVPDDTNDMVDIFVWGTVGGPPSACLQPAQARGERGQTGPPAGASPVEPGCFR